MPPEGLNLEAVAERAVYVGSPHHKDCPSFVTDAPAPRADASICPRDLAWRREDIQQWLREAIRKGNVGTWQRDFPEYVWHKVGDITYEARLMRNETGEYKGHPLERDEVVRGFRA